MEKQISDVDDAFSAFIFQIILSLILITVSLCIPNPRYIKQNNATYIPLHLFLYNLEISQSQDG
jgi:hypothetical protein